MNLDSEKSLQHHGVKGQKWGVRKDQEYVGQRSKKEEEISVENRKKERNKKKKIFTGVVLITAGIAATALIINKYKKGKNTSVKQVVEQNPKAVAIGKQYVTNYNKVPVSNLSSSRRLGIKSYMGAKRKYNIHF